MRSAATQVAVCVRCVALSLVAGAARRSARPRRPNDPRVGLKAGLARRRRGARATWNWSRACPSRRASSIRRRRPDRDAARARARKRPTAGGTTPPAGHAGGRERRPPAARRPPAVRRQTAAAAVSNFTNSDLAFSGNHVFVGNYHGFNTYDIENAAASRSCWPRSSARAARATCRCTATCCSCRWSRRAAGSIAARRACRRRSAPSASAASASSTSAT